MTCGICGGAASGRFQSSVACCCKKCAPMLKEEVRKRVGQNLSFPPKEDGDCIEILGVQLWWWRARWRVFSN